MAWGSGFRGGRLLMEGAGLPFKSEEAEAYFSERAIDLEPWPEPQATVPEIADLFTEVLPRPGAVVLLALPSGTMLLRHLLGAVYGGAVPVPIPVGTPPARVRGLAHRFGASLLVTPRRRAGQDAGSRIVGGAQITPLRAPHAHHPSGGVIILTSGTSGIFSGCLHRSSSLLGNAAMHAASVGLGQADTILVMLPLHFSYALVAQALAGLVTGARLIICGPPHTSARFADAVRRHRVTSTSLTPFFMRRLIGGHEPETLRMLTIGGDALPATDVARLLELRPGRELYITYGLTEAGPRVATLAAHAEPPHRYASVGRPMDGVKVALRKVRGQPDAVGELLVSSDTVLVRKVGVPQGRPADCFAGPGTIATGDLFRIDSDGYLYFAGRLTDPLVVDGVKVSLESVRSLAAAQPGVARATISVRRDAPDEGYFDLELEMDDPTRESAHRVRDALYRRLLRAERPRRITVVPVREDVPK
ncbi:class I adenylate-forming enzyme family protein [Actinomadura fulvescens]|uniref:Class I adenylate-forming enzyme family protein n=1 Tax=Actinomadura fulvescens TaxID=46160 RepID=A0ABP6CE29_9ACTN